MDIENTWHFKIYNSRALKWLKKLGDKTEVSWLLLDWTCIHDREREEDIRNQLMHNLRGTEKNDVIDYLYGNPTDKSKIDYTQKVSKVYKEVVKNPFLRSLKELGLLSLDNNLEENELQKDLATLAAELDKVADLYKTAEPDK